MHIKAQCTPMNQEFVVQVMIEVTALLQLACALVPQLKGDRFCYEPHNRVYKKSQKWILR